LCFY